jgi:hypothetical protein
LPVDLNEEGNLGRLLALIMSTIETEENGITLFLLGNRLAPASPKGNGSKATPSKMIYSQK